MTLIHEALSQAMWNLPDAKLDWLMDSYQGKMEEGKTEKVRTLAMRLIKDALMKSDPILAALGEATDKGIAVEILSRAEETETDLKLYEIGNMLIAMGASSPFASGNQMLSVGRFELSRLILFIFTTTGRLCFTHSANAARSSVGAPSGVSSGCWRKY